MLFIQKKADSEAASQPLPILTDTDKAVQFSVKHDPKQEIKQELVQGLQKEFKQEHTQDKPRYEKNSRYRAAIHASTPAPSYRYDCILCTPEKHPLYQCQKFWDMDVKTRRDKVRTAKLCFNCFVPGLRNTDCRSPATSRVCSGKHNTLLHKESVHNSATSMDILMMTANVLLTGPGGRRFTARVLLIQDQRSPWCLARQCKPCS